MKVTVEKLKNSEVKLTVEVSDDTLQTYKKDAVNELQNQVKVDGFRPGHIPAEVLEQRVGERAFKAHMMEFALSDTYTKALQKEKIKAIAHPKINVVSETPFKYEATVAVLPEVKIKDSYKKVSVKAKDVKVEEKEIAEVMKNLLNRAKKWKDVEREAKKGDRVEIDFEGFDTGGASLEGTKSKNHPIIIGENTFIPGFEDNLIEMKKDEEKDFHITFPKDYHSKSFQNKEVRFHVKLNRVEEGEERELNDAFVEELTGGKQKTVKGLEEEVKAELSHEKEHAMEAEIENEIIEKLAEHFDAEIPETLIERETDLLLERMKSDVKRAGLKWEDYEEAKKKEGKDFRKEYRKQAEKQVLIRLGIEKLYDEEKIEVNADDVNEQIAEMEKHYPPEYAGKLKDFYEKDAKGKEQIESQLMLKKLLKKFRA